MKTPAYILQLGLVACFGLALAVDAQARGGDGGHGGQGSRMGDRQMIGQALGQPSGDATWQRTRDENRAGDRQQIHDRARDHVPAQDGALPDQPVLTHTGQRQANRQAAAGAE